MSATDELLRSAERDAVRPSDARVRPGRPVAHEEGTLRQVR